MNCILKYEKLIYSICFSFSKNKFDAEDLAQETFLTAYKKLSSFDGENFKAWITCIAVNKCRDFLKKAREISDIDNEEIPDMSNSPEILTIEKYEEDEVKRLIDTLDEPYKTVAGKYFIENVKLSEYAKSSRQNLKTLQTRLYRAKKMLKILWREEHQDAYFK